MDPLTAQQTDEYLARLGVPKKEPFTADLDLLRTLIEAHLQRVTFENIDVLLGRPIALDVNSLFAKVVERGRGGYCFELNSLFARLLQALGYQLRLRMARVRWGLPLEAPITLQQHVVLIVDLPEGEHLVDVGFGAANPYLPLPLNETQVSVNHPYWLRQIGAEADCEPGTLELCIRGRDEWITLYRIEPRDQRWRDCVPLNWYTCTNPDSIMRRVLMMGRTDGEAWLSLFNGRYRRRLRVCGGNAVQKRQIKDVDDLLSLIQTEFCLQLCPDDLESLRSRLLTFNLEELRF
ncbi:arylamine N-acetyltransferase [Rhipicephalus microplus]|uniref:arylamine N-acetyltransferase n=1 Tax=Rhipicephalus microplus TaxID=6941 RepID=UPI003F6C77B2